MKLIPFFARLFCCKHYLARRRGRERVSENEGDVLLLLFFLFVFLSNLAMAPATSPELLQRLNY